MYLSRCSKLIAAKLCVIPEMHAKVRRGGVAGYATDETLAYSPKERTRWCKDIENICKVYNID